jgi:hypothetical protein
MNDSFLTWRNFGCFVTVNSSTKRLLHENRTYCLNGKNGFESKIVTFDWEKNSFPGKTLAMKKHFRENRIVRSNQRGFSENNIVLNARRENILSWIYTQRILSFDQ